MGSSLSSTLSKNSNSVNGDGGADFRTRLHDDMEAEGPGVHNEGQILDAQPGIDSINEARFTRLMHALQRIARLQREATRARITSRQIHREALLKRKNVWVSDANFMKEVQGLVAEGKLAGFEELLRLANACQNARDSLGPIEQDSIEAEQRWEGQVWKLRHAEQHLYFEFKDEFETAENYPSASPSVASSPYRSSSDVASQASNKDILDSPLFRSDQKAEYIELSSSFGSVPPGLDNPTEHTDYTPRDHILLGIEAMTSREPDVEELMRDWDSGFGNIEAALSRPYPPASLGPSVPLLEQVQFRGLDYSPKLLTDFSSIKERINRWLEDTTLSSHVEGMSLFNILQHELDAQNLSVPSNWAQLVIAYWELELDNVPSLSQQALAAEKKRRELATNETKLPAVGIHDHHEPGQGTLCFTKSSEPGGDYMAGTLSSDRHGSQNKMMSSMSSGPTLISPRSLSPLSPLRSQRSFDSRDHDLHKGHEPP